ncbi:MAG TPA: hypothetical protein VLG12_03690 [Candidatus Saccharimonadales bacterium]|nr:hypothetical protein [Candidatus Saccharimonadales bacterium]
MNIFHEELQSRWGTFSIFEQMANIGTEVGRALRWKKKNNAKMSQNAFYRCLELIDFTIDDDKNRTSLKELTRMRELLVDYFMGTNIYNSSDQGWDKYFYPFNFAARNQESL